MQWPEYADLSAFMPTIMAPKRLLCRGEPARRVVHKSKNLADALSGGQQTKKNPEPRARRLRALGCRLRTSETCFSNLAQPIESVGLLSKSTSGVGAGRPGPGSYSTTVAYTALELCCWSKVQIHRHALQTDLLLRSNLYR